MNDKNVIGLKKGTVKLLEHNKEWHNIAQKSIVVLKSILEDIVVDIQHVGSTSIDGIWAKPIIDLVVGLNDKNEILDKSILLQLEQIGYIHDKEHDNAGKIFFYKGFEDIVTHHVHVVEYNKKAWNSYVGLRDYLNANPEMAKKYENIKLMAQKQCNNNLDKYYNAKRDLLKEINSKIHY